MALTMAIVNLDRSVRTQFDQRVDRIHRRMQAEYNNRSYQQDNENEQPADTTAQTSNEARPVEITTITQSQPRIDNESGERQHDITQTDRSQPPTENESIENATVMDQNANITSPEEQEDASHHPRSRTQSTEIAVDYEELTADSEPSMEDNQSESADTIDQEINSLSDTGSGRLSCCDFYRKHWMGNLITGLFSGFLFILLGVIFLVNGDDFPFYAGIMLIVLGLAPCCMALNRYRYARIYERERRRALQRLNALRRAHRRNLRDGRSRRQVYPDLPPSYANLGFELDEGDVELDNFSVTTDGGSFVLPTYDQYMKKSKEKQDKKSSKTKTSEGGKGGERRLDEDHVPPPNYSESVSVPQNRIVRSQPQEFVQITMPLDSIQIVEAEHEDNSAENIDPPCSLSPPGDMQNEPDETISNDHVIHEREDDSQEHGNEENSSDVSTVV